MNQVVKRYMRCPLCGMSRTFDKLRRPAEAAAHNKRNDFWPLEWLEQRFIGGRGHGWIWSRLPLTVYDVPALEQLVESLEAAREHVLRTIRDLHEMQIAKEQASGTQIQVGPINIRTVVLPNGQRLVVAVPTEEAA